MEIIRKIETKKNRVIPKMLMATIGSSIFFLVLAFTIHTYGGLWIDQPVVNFVQVYITGTKYSLISFFTNLGDKVVVISVAVISLFILWWKTRDYIGLATIAVVLAGFTIGFVYLMICIFIYEKVVVRKELTRKNKSEITV
jgi:hypothetical protein